MTTYNSSNQATQAPTAPASAIQWREAARLIKAARKRLALALEGLVDLPCPTSVANDQLQAIRVAIDDVRVRLAPAVALAAAIPPTARPPSLAWLVEDGRHLDDLARLLCSAAVDEPGTRLAALRSTQSAFWRLRETRWWILEDGPAATAKR